MADGTKPDAGSASSAPTLATGAAAIQPTAPGAAVHSIPPEVPGTIQLPRGQGPPIAGDREPAPGDAASPLLSTMTPSTAAPMPSVAPPVTPQDWRYQISTEIARGGMGRVVNATDTVLGRNVALKEALSIDPETVRRFHRETKITARLEHPAIVPVHDAGMSPSGAPFYVMRKISGRALEDLVARADTVEKRLALVPHVVTAAQAIAHAHSRGIVHRDIKPSNILIGELGETIMIDWGLAKAIGEADEVGGPVQRVLEDDDDAALKTRAGIVFGTPGFMAPEQLRGNPVDERCDVYALGATLYHLLVRRPPHHHKNPDEMMKATVAGPPTPLRELVEGVPPELATIVDKALAHDATKRYQDAGALAEDLSSFLTGQLVAAHHYTAQERFVRFIKKHRTAVGIGTAAIVTLIAVVSVAFVRVRDERDRADEQKRIAVTEKKIAVEQREEVIKKARELTLTNARHASATDPTSAAAMAKTLGATHYWRHARDVGAAARANGIAFNIKASHHTLSLELSRDGQRALTAGEDGVVRLVDLDKRTSKEIANLGGAVLAKFGDGERKIVLYQGNRLTIIDAATSDKRDVTASTAIRELEISGPIAYWADTAGAVWKLDLAGGNPTQVELGEPINVIAPSPDGRWLAYGGAKHLLIADRSNPTLPPENISEGVVKELRWAADSKRLAVQIDDEVLDINTEPSPRIFDRFWVRADYGLAYSNNRIYGAGPNGIRLLSRSEREDKLRLQAEGHTLGVHEGRDRVVISAKPQGEIVVLSEAGDHTLYSPLPIALVATSARGPWIVAAADNMLLVWNLDGFEPKKLETYPPTSARFVTGDTMIITYFDDSAEWIDLRSGKVTPIGMMPALSSVVAAPDGAEAIAIDSTRKAWRVAGIGQPQALPGEHLAASYIDNTRLVLANDKGLRLEDARQNKATPLLAHTAALRELATSSTNGGWVAASFADGLVWRKHLAGTSEGRLPLQEPPPDLPLALAPDGTVVLGVGSELRVWRADGTIDTIVKDLKPILRVLIVEPGTVMAISSDGIDRIIDVAKKRVVDLMPVGKSVSAAHEGSLLAGPTITGGVEVIDPAVVWRWPLASPQKGVQQRLSDIEIARDGSRVLARIGDSVAVWTLHLPRTQDETVPWLDKLTNATADDPTGPLGWR